MSCERGHGAQDWVPLGMDDSPISGYCQRCAEDRMTYDKELEQKIRAATCEGCAVNSPTYQTHPNNPLFHRVTDTCNGGKCTSKHAELLPIITERDRALIKRTAIVMVGDGLSREQLDRLIEEVLRGGQ